MIDILIIGCSTATVYFLSKEIEHEKVFDVLVKYWSEVEDLARDHDVAHV